MGCAHSEINLTQGETMSNTFSMPSSLRRLSQRGLYLLAATLVSVFTLSMSTVSAAPNDIKAVPTAPTGDSQGVTAPVKEKEAQAKDQKSQIQAQALAYTASLSASSTNLWPTQYSTLTASTNQNVGPTPYYLSIYDATAGTYIKICGTGTTCAISVTQSTATTHTYRAYVSTYPYVNPPANQQAVSGNVTVTWRGVSVSLTASPTTNYLNGTATLTASASADVGPSPFYIQIFDATTGTRLNYCGFGTTCTATTSQAVATTHKFLAYVSSYGTVHPPTNIQATSAARYVTWSNTGYRVSLASTGSGSSRTLTATSNINVGPTAYYIEIFNLRTGARIAVCGTGTTCSTSVSLAFGQTEFAAFVSSASTTLPPLNTQASSNVVSAFYIPILVP